MRVRILHGNANTLMQSGLNALINRGGGVDDLKICCDEEDLLEYLEKDEFDLVILDHHSNGYHAVDSVKQIKAKFPEQKVLIISDILNTQNVLQVLEKGIQGYLTYECDEDEIIHAIFAVAKGDKFYCNKVLDIILNKHLFQEDENCEPTVLTARETEITALVAKGNTTKEIADQLHLSQHTVHTHRKNIMKKLGVKSSSEVILYAVNVGLVTP